MERGKIWILNLDAELEMASPRGYAPTREMQRRVAENIEGARALLEPDDLLLEELPPNFELAGRKGRAWCPTPRARRAFAEAGVELERVPGFEVVRRVNDRKFCAELGQSLVGAAFFEEGVDRMRELVGTVAGNWLLKRSFGVAGRGRRSVAMGTWSDEDERWISKSLEVGGLQVEPRVAIEAEFALHGMLHGKGGVSLGEICTQRCDASGAWQATEVADPGELTGDERSRLLTEAERTARALTAAGYFGPFGIDAYRWRDTRGGVRFNPRSEINARYSLGWSVGMRGVSSR